MAQNNHFIKVKSKSIIRFLLIVFALQLVSCEKQKAENKKMEPVNNVKVENDSSFYVNNPYYKFIEKNRPEALKNDELIYFKEQDIDLDGKKEALIALGEIDKDDSVGTFVSDLFLLRNDNGKIKELAYDFGSNSYFIYDVKLISLQGKGQSYIYLGLTNREKLKGFSLFEIVNNKAKPFFQSLSEIDTSGDDKLLDDNKDGKFEGYVKFRYGPDALFYKIKQFYNLKNNVFKPDVTHVEIPSQYPETIEKLLLQYISLRSLNFGESEEINKQLKLICTDKNASSLKWDKDVWGNAYLANHYGLEEPIEFEINLETNSAIANCLKYNQKVYQYQFELKEANDKWQITKVIILKNGEE